MQLEKNLSMGKQWFIRCEKKQKISCTWEILVFLFAYAPYNTNCPLLYSFTNIVPLNHMEFYFNLSVTITDFCCPDTAQRCFFSLRKIPPNFSEHTSPLTNPFSESFWELMVLWARGVLEWSAKGQDWLFRDRRKKEASCLSTVNFGIVSRKR